ncbi:CHRD domain-containing protein [Aquabacterium sp. A7-Y]|uniref:CHRD domain-containing protein n=1 Tax=Aquabacterium sp. A7-Y TaxID=1349605 RepID=UPI00223DB0AB|nr:CHRD domain-containing protein [Aquabacterium sp. A7-Y]MCW7538088.1 CHRD domain-containing protein [Aquabacterium sp. A7-Y]
MTFTLRTVSTWSAITAATLFLVACGGSGDDDGPPGSTQGPAVETISAVLDGDQEAPQRIASVANGSATFSLERSTRTLSGTVTVDGVTPSVAHIHAGAPGVAGPIALPLSVHPGGARLAPTVLSTEQLAQLDEGALYINVHSTTHPSGEIRGQLGREVFVAELGAAQEVAPTQVVSSASGVGRLVLNPVTRALSGELELSGIEATAAHIHSAPVGQNGPIVINLEDHGGHGHFTVPENTVLNEAQVKTLRGGGLYLNVHSATHPGGEIRGQVGRRVRVAVASGRQEVPANGSTASGRAFFAYGLADRSLQGRLTLSGMNATAAHLHQAPAGVNGPIAVNLEQNPADAEVWTLAPGVTLSPSQAEALLADGLYVNAHSAAFAAGEVRGQLLAR